jgi:predicted MFS family arabinose efflux permease
VIAALIDRGAVWLLGAGLVSLTGDWVLRIGLAFWVYTLTGSTLASAMTLLASFVPQILAGSLAGVFVDRWSPKTTMIVSNVVLAMGLVPLLLVRSSGEMWIVYLVLAWEGTVQQFFLPAEQKALPLLVGAEHLLRVNALGSQNQNLSRLIGSAIGGTVVSALGLGAVVWIDIASFLLAVAMIARLRLGRPLSGPILGEQTSPGGQTIRHRVASLRREWAEGIRLSTSDRILRLLLIFIAITSVGEGTMGTLFAPFVRSELHGSGADYGVINSLQAVGGIAGALLITVLGNRIDPATLLSRAACAFGVIDLTMFLYPLVARVVWPAELLMVIVGAPGAFMVASALTLLQQQATDEHRGRVFGALGAVEGLAVVVGTLAAGLLSHSLGIVPVLVTQGAGYIVAGLAVRRIAGGAHRSARVAVPDPVWLR